jgi:hypothetical protein
MSVDPLSGLHFTRVSTLECIMSVVTKLILIALQFCSFRAHVQGPREIFCVLYHCVRILLRCRIMRRVAGAICLDLRFIVLKRIDL